TNINRDSGSTHIEVLQAFVKEKGLDAGFAYDGDADRCLAIDDKGNIIDGDLILYICGCYLKERGELKNNTVVTTIMSNLGLYKAFDKKGIAYEKTTVGDKYVYENMVNNGHILGGEQSGHIIFRKYAATGDGVLTSLMLMEVMLEKKTLLSELTKDIKIYPQILENVRVASKPLAKQDEEVVEAVAKIEKELGEEGRILLRESGTEPVIRVMVEASTDEICRKHVNHVVEVLKRRGHVVS
ncbi:MAG: phosphoglucosamine mutase, partial [Acetivibrio sp.]